MFHSDKVHLTNLLVSVFFCPTFKVLNIFNFFFNIYLYSCRSYHSVYQPVIDPMSQPVLIFFFFFFFSSLASPVAAHRLSSCDSPDLELMGFSICGTQAVAPQHVQSS